MPTQPSQRTPLARLIAMADAITRQTKPNNNNAETRNGDRSKAFCLVCCASLATAVETSATKH